MTTWKSLAVLAVTIPATAYVVGETVVDEPATPSRSAVTLSEAVDQPRAVTGAATRERPASGAGGGPDPSDGPATCDADDDADDQDG